MSRKTKQQKIIADLRRQLQQSKPSPVAKNKETIVFENTLSTAPVAIADYKYVKHDLLRTLVLTVLAIGVQVVLWYVIGRK